MLRERSISVMVELTRNVIFGKQKSKGFPGNKSMSEIGIFHCNEYFKALLNVFLISNVMFG